MKGSEEGFSAGGLLWVLQLKRVLRRVLRRGSENGVSGRCPERLLGEYDPLGVRPFYFSIPWLSSCSAFARARAPKALLPSARMQESLQTHDQICTAPFEKGETTQIKQTQTSNL